MVVSPDGRNAYVVSQDDNAILAFARDPATGALRGIGCIQDVGGSLSGCNSAGGLNRPQGVAVSPDGKSVYVASYGSDAVASLVRSTTTGARCPAAVGNCSGKSRIPRTSAPRKP